MSPSDHHDGGGGGGAALPYELRSPGAPDHSSMSEGYRPSSREYSSSSHYLSYSPLHPRGGYAGQGSNGGLYGPDRSGYPPDHAGEQRAKRRRGNLPKPVTDLLKAWFRAHKNHPYPSEEEKQMLMCQTGLTITQVGTRSFPLRTNARWESYGD